MTLRICILPNSVSSIVGPGGLSIRLRTWNASLTWQIEFDAGAPKDLRRLDRQVARCITLSLRDRIGVLEDPRRFGAPLRRGGERVIVGEQRNVRAVLPLTQTVDLYDEPQSNRDSTRIIY